MIIDNWGLGDGFHIGEVKCPYGKKGDRLWVCESMRKSEAGRQDNIYYSADNKGVGNVVWGKIVDYGWEDKSSVPSIHMPRWASRINLEIVDIRVERVADITPEDCQQEGHEIRLDIALIGNPIHLEAAKYWFMDLWDSINGKRQIKHEWEDDNGVTHSEMVDAHYSWADNPYVWIVEFKRIK